jgi:hypothetical protein
MAKTRAQENKAIRQDALRQWLSEKCTAQHLIDNIDKIEGLDTSSDTFANELNKYKIANDQRIRVMSKYLPDLKQSDISIDADVVAKEKTRKELEDKLLAAGIDLEALSNG